jgi:RNA polymerase sigma factor (sigma-70 family)
MAAVTLPESMPPDDTRALLEAWHGGDEAALDELLRRHMPWLHRYVRQRLGDGLREQIESMDVVQSVAADLMRHAPRFVVADQRQFRALLGKILENNLRDKSRRRSAQKRGGDLQVPATDSILDLAPARGTPSPVEAAASEEYRAWVQLALTMLSPEDRRVLELRRLDEQAFAEVGAELGISADAARMRFNAAMPRLAQAIQGLRTGDWADTILGDTPGSDRR